MTVDRKTTYPSDALGAARSILRFTAMRTYDEHLADDIPGLIAYLAGLLGSRTTRGPVDPTRPHRYAPAP